MTYPASSFVAALISVGLFAILVTRRRFAMRGSDRNSTTDFTSLAGIALQSLGFAIASIGRIPIASALNAREFGVTALVLIFGLGACLLFGRATKALGGNWSFVARTRDDHELVRHGPFARVRHPIYLAMLMLLLSVGVGFGHAMQLVAALPLFLVGTMVRIRIEERLLKQAFGSAFDDYARSVPALVPRLH